MEENSIFNPEELRELKTQYNRAKDLLEKINSLHIRYDAAIQSFETRTIDVEKVSNDVKDRFLTVENIKNDSVNFLSEIKSNLEKVQSSISQVEEGFNKFQNIKGKLEGTQSEIEIIASGISSVKNDVESVKISAQQRLVDIDLQFTQVQEKVSLLQKSYEDFVAVNAKIIDSKTGLQAILDQVVELQKTTGTIVVEIKTYNEESKNYLDKIQANKEKSDELIAQVQENLEKIKVNQQEVEKITALITDTGLANAFQKREKILRTSSYVWLGVFVASIIALTVVVLIIFPGLENIPEFKVIIYRLTLTSPLLFIIGVALKQYSNERGLNEKYAFKATVAAVIKSHADFLMYVTEKAGTENAVFIREALEKLYLEPYDKSITIKDIKKEIESALENKEHNKISKILLRAKELKELIPNDETLKSVVDLISKIK